MGKRACGCIVIVRDATGAEVAFYRHITLAIPDVTIARLDEVEDRMVAIRGLKAGNTKATVYASGLQAALQIVVVAS